MGRKSKASYPGALPVSVLTSDDIEALGIDSGDELLQQIAVNGANFFNEQDWNGGVNGAGGDVGSFNIRNLGTGNTLALINGEDWCKIQAIKLKELAEVLFQSCPVNSNNIPVEVMGLKFSKMVHLLYMVLMQSLVL